MTSKRRIGGSVYAQHVQRIRQATIITRRALRRMLEDDAGPQTRAVLIAKIALEQNAVLEAVGELEKYGEKARDERKS